VKKPGDKGDSKKSGTISETVNDKKKEQEAEMSPTPTRQNKKQSNEPAVEMSDEKSDTNTRISLRNKTPAIVTTTKPRRSMASAKTSTTPQNSQSSKSSDSIAISEPKLEMNTSSSLDTSNNNALLSKPASTDSGLLSIIKSEPVQISASSTISLTDIEQTNDSIANTTTSSNSSTMKFEDEKAYKAWKKSIMMVMTNIAAHK